MRRLLALFFVVPLLFSGLVVAVSIPFATTAAAACAPHGDRNYTYKVTNVTKSYKPTGVSSNWVHPKYATMTINYSQASTSTWSATVTGTVSAEAGVIFAKASTSISVAVGKQWSKTQTWSYTATVPHDPKHQYRFVQRQETRKFLATKYFWSNTTCDYTRKSSTVARVEMPRMTVQSLVWKLERRSA